MTNRQLATDITDAIEVFVEAIVAHNAVRIDGDLIGKARLAANVQQARRALVEVITTSFMLWDYQD